jgi:XTP/dITP diphosphohydrolase
MAVVSGSAQGLVATRPKGANGFGYDPVFVFFDLGRSYAELAPEEKNRLSHRARAFQNLREPGVLQDILATFP